MSFVAKAFKRNIGSFKKTLGGLFGGAPQQQQQAMQPAPQQQQAMPVAPAAEAARQAPASAAQRTGATSAAPRRRSAGASLGGLQTEDGLTVRRTVLGG